MPRPLPPRQPSLLARRWAGPARPPGGPLLGALVVAAGISAVSIPPDRPGAGWLISAVACVVALGVAAARSGRSGGTGAPEHPGWGRHLLRLIWAVATVALVGVGTLRAAGWLFVLCLLTAGMTALLALADGRSVRALLLSTLVPPVALGRSLPWATKGLRGAGPTRSAVIGRSVVTVLISTLLLLVFGFLFSSADAAFAERLNDVLPEISVGTVTRWIFVFVVVGAGLLAAAFVLTAPPDLTGLGSGARNPVRRWEWAVPVLLLDLLFAAFVQVQITTLFGGSGYVTRPGGPTFAEYARSGFWQLLVVSALTLLVIGGAARWAPRRDPADRLLIRLLLGTLAALSLVVVASALYRMDIYTDAYGATRLRLLVAACELWLGLIFVLVLLAGVRLRAGWLPQLVLGSAVLALLGLAVLNPDRYIAERNVERYERTGQIDAYYLAGLSADAAPALDRLPAEFRNCALADVAWEIEDDNWRTANFGRWQARRVLAERPVPTRVVSCSHQW